MTPHLARFVWNVIFGPFLFFLVFTLFGNVVVAFLVAIIIVIIGNLLEFNSGTGKDNCKIPTTTHEESS